MDFDDFEDFEDDFCNIEADFIGRSRDLEQLHAAWKHYKIFGVFGIRSVGKSRLVTEFLRRKRKSYTFNLQEINVDLNLHKDIESVHSSICAQLGVQPEVNSVQMDTWITQIRTEINRLTSQRNAVIVVFDNAESFVEAEVGDSLKSLLIDLIKHTKHVKLFVTSTTKVLFSQQHKVFFNYELLPLQPSDSEALLKSIIQDTVELGQYKDAIIKLSEGLPLLILMIGGELVEDQGMVTPADMAELLSTCRLRTLSREYYGQEDRVADVYKKFIGRLTKFYMRRFEILEFIPGSFNAAEAKQMLDYKSVAQVKDQVLIHLRRRFMLTYDPMTHRFNIQGILRECIHTFFALNNIADVRKKYFDTFSRVMQEISVQMGTADYTKALKEFTLEQANLQKLITEVMYTKEDTYHCFIEIATTCTSLIENFLAGNSEQFYDGCLRMSELYGKPRDKAVVHIALGSLYTNVKGDLPKGEENLHSALSVLESNDRDISLATGYQRLGWNLYSQGRNREAVGFFEKSLNISSTLGKPAELLKLQSLNSLGIVNTVLGNFEDAERYHFRSLDIRRVVQGKNHPAFGATLNNIAIYYNQTGQLENALKYYQDGLEVKRKNKHTPVISLIYSLSNLAAEHSRLKQFKESHALLDEAMELINSQEIPSKDGLSLIHDTRGKVLQAEKKFKEAATEFEEAVTIRREFVPGGITHLESLMHTANSYCSMGDYKASLRYADKALALKESACKTMPKNTFITECLEIVAEVYERTNNNEKYRTTLWKIESELLRLERFSMEEMNERKLEKIRAQLNDVKQKLDQLSEKDRQFQVLLKKAP